MNLAKVPTTLKKLSTHTIQVNLWLGDTIIDEQLKTLNSLYLYKNKK